MAKKEYVPRYVPEAAEIFCTDPDCMVSRYSRREQAQLSDRTDEQGYLLEARTFDDCEHTMYRIAPHQDVRPEDRFPEL